jgi:hypothetical protein
MPVKVGYITDNGIVPLEKDEPGPKTSTNKTMQKGNENSAEKFLPLDIKPFMMHMKGFSPCDSFVLGSCVTLDSLCNIGMFKIVVAMALLPSILSLFPYDMIC